MSDLNNDITETNLPYGLPYVTKFETHVSPV